ncbi:hypothetical protein LU631_18830 [Erwinia tracheiphila]|uniref:hypothetical protein n=1 Tax=Erwinia tracheiphila TaxID=65700 RepID=UPI00033AA4B2|nr:hypothetical protein [Erwinia tracheiphila]EOS96222.1 hypothetical protein ETR_04024 [Erwinia tracheiphila PSU-1]UIA86872.1 hypothetical protein LU631_18830 [Erwinia tracheiphila]UIA95228.1 hypothetical protein LU633_17285 [Erwinia tracheiphila]
MLSKLIRLFRKVLSEISGAIIITVALLGVIVSVIECQGIMRVITPVLIVAVCFALYYLSWLISAKEDRK